MRTYIRPKDTKRSAWSVAKPGARVFVLVMAALLLWGFSPLVPQALGEARTGSHKVGVFEDVTVTEQESWDSVVVVGGDVTVLGTVNTRVVAVFGDVTLGPHAQVGGMVEPGERSVICVFGDISTEPGATVKGETFTLEKTSAWGKLPFWGRSGDRWSVRHLLGWFTFAVFMVVVALVAAAVAPRQLVRVRDRVRSHFFSSLGWGALAGLVGVPVITVLLAVTIIGLVAVVPWLAVVVPWLWLFGFTGVGAALGGVILRCNPENRARIMATAVLGAFVLTLLSWVPFAGPVILFLLGLVGFGATISAIWRWMRRDRRAATRTPVQQGGES